MPAFAQIRRLLGALILVGILFPAGYAFPEDLACGGTKPGNERTEIRCVLWDIAGFLHEVGGLGFLRTEPVRLSPNLWVSIEATSGKSASPWPVSILFRFYKDDTSRSPIEEINDRGLNGLVKDRDSWTRRAENNDLVDLLADAEFGTRAGTDHTYITRLREILEALKGDRPALGGLAWTSPAPGLEIARPTAMRYIRFGETKLWILRIDPNHYRFEPMHYRESPGSKPMDVRTWANRIPEASIIFNAGQYYPDYGYMGLFQKHDIDFGSGLHPKWNALLLSGGLEGDSYRPSTALVDLRKNGYEPKTGQYAFAVQSYMLFDETGHIRVHRTDKLASRTVLARDDSGRLILVVVPGACSLYDLARLLVDSGLNLRLGMGLDGGLESQLFVRVGGMEDFVSGEWVERGGYQYRLVGLRRPLPAVVAVIPKD